MGQLQLHVKMMERFQARYLTALEVSHQPPVLRKCYVNVFSIILVDLSRKLFRLN